jgi:hypothetical protein
MEEQTRQQESARQAQEARQQESARQTQEAARRVQQRVRESAGEATKVTGQLAGLGTETLTVWADVTQQAMRNMLELSSHTTQESAGQMAECLRMNVDGLRELQAAALRWQMIWPEAFRDPMRYYQRSLEQSIEATQRLLELTRRNAETMVQACQRMETAAESTTRTLGETFREATTRMQDVLARSERLRAA